MLVPLLVPHGGGIHYPPQLSITQDAGLVLNPSAPHPVWIVRGQTITHRWPVIPMESEKCIERCLADMEESCQTQLNEFISRVNGEWYFDIGVVYGIPELTRVSRSMTTFWTPSVVFEDEYRIFSGDIISDFCIFRDIVTDPSKISVLYYELRCSAPIETSLE